MSIGWIRLNLDEFPDSDVHAPDYIFIAHNTYFELGITPSMSENETNEQVEIRLAKRVYDYSFSQV